MKKYLKRDSFLLGVIMGTTIPWVFFGILFGINHLIGSYHYDVPFLKISTLMLISVIANVFLMRYYMVKLKFEKTGKGFLILTFSYIILFFVYDYLIK